MQEPATNAATTQPPLWLLVFISALAPIAMNGVLSANTAVMHDLDTRYSLAQMVLSIYLMAAMVAQVTLGNLADRIGRRPVMIGSLIVFGIGSLVCLMAPNIEILLAGRCIQGFGAAVCVFLPRTILRDVHPKDKAASAIGYMVTAMMIAPLFGPAVFGWLTDVSSWRIIYVVLAVLGFALAGLSFTFQNETLRPNHKTKQKGWQSNRLLLRDREYIAYVLIMSGSVGIYYCFLAGAPYVVMELRNHSASSYGIWFTFVATGYLSGNFIAGRFSEKYGTQRMIRISIAPMLMGVVLFWWFSTSQALIGLFAPMLLVALSNGMCLPNLTSAAMSLKPEISGSASGLLGTIQIGAAIVITIALSAVLKSTAIPMFVAITISAVVSLVGLYLLSSNEA